MPSLPETLVDPFSLVPGPSSGSAPSSGPGSSGSAKGLVPRYTDHDLVTAVNQAINTLKRKIQDVYECAICLSITRDGHIVQCQRGHIFCSICLDKSNRTTCPTCEAPIDRNNKIRALAAEKLIDSVDLEFPCKHADCQIKLPRRIYHPTKTNVRKEMFLVQMVAAMNKFHSILCFVTWPIQTRPPRTLLVSFFKNLVSAKTCTLIMEA